MKVRIEELVNDQREMTLEMSTVPREGESITIHDEEWGIVRNVNWVLEKDGRLWVLVRVR